MQNLFFQPLQNIQISPIVKIAERARQVESAYEQKTGKKFIHLERGELNLPTPQLLINDIKTALEQGKTKYPKSGGELPLKESICRKLQTMNGIDYISSKDIIITAGGQEALNIAFNLFANQKGAGFSPIWSVAVENFVPYANIEFAEVKMNDDFSIDWNELEKVMPTIKFFYFNNPQNPTGKVFTYDEISHIVKLCKKYDVFIISDEAYEDIIFDGKKHVSTMSVDEAKDYKNIISAFTFSKPFSATGIRVGYILTQNEVVLKIVNGVQYTHTAGVPTFLQYGLVNFLDVDLNPQHIEFQQRRDLFYEGLKDIKGMTVAKPEGAFYFYPDVSEGMKKYPGKEVLDVLLDHGISVVPGSGFTKHGHFLNNMRISYSAVNQEEISMAVERFKEIF